MGAYEKEDGHDACPTFYSVPLTDQDLATYITEGRLKTHHLCAFAAGLSPVGHLGKTKLPEVQLYSASLYDSKTKMGMIFMKVRVAKDMGLIKILQERRNANTDGSRDYIGLLQSCAWLQGEGVELDEKFKNFVETYKSSQPKEHRPIGTPEKAYKERVEDAQRKGVRYTRNQDTEWAKDNGYTVESVCNLRKQHAPKEWTKRGRRKTKI